MAERLGVTRDQRLLEQALVHSSYVNEHPDVGLVANERLEFLGDAVLSLVISEALWRMHPAEPEGY
ncbi:MAG: ribonuclease III domain-containing protein [Chloroflexota bacterium]